MYILDKHNKCLLEAEKCTFKSLNFTERQDLQEWIAKEPSSLGEDLLIIQKEYADWDKTKERLDLLALDKSGNLVIIENKLDDSGKDVTWQAIKYASYCSTLDTKQIIEIFREYLKKSGSSISAEDALCDFFDVKGTDDLKLNVGNSQRIILVAAKFTNEVTSSVLWLRNFKVNISCVKVTPSKFGDQIMLEFDKIIPIPEAETYLVQKANKEQEDSLSDGSTPVRYINRQKFWAEFIEYNKQHQGLFAGSTAVTDNWISKSVSSIRGGTINVIINKDNCRAELYLNTGEQTTNKAIFDKLFSIKDEIDAQLPGMEWQRMDDKVTCRVRLDKQYSYLIDEDRTKIFEFFLTIGQKMMNIFQKAGTKLMLDKWKN